MGPNRAALLSPEDENIQFPKCCVSSSLEFRTMDKVKDPSDSERKTPMLTQGTKSLRRLTVTKLGEKLAEFRTTLIFVTVCTVAHSRAVASLESGELAQPQTAFLYHSCPHICA
jgi:hypothetical protein